MCRQLCPHSRTQFRRTKWRGQKSSAGIVQRPVRHMDRLGVKFKPRDESGGLLTNSLLAVNLHSQRLITKGKIGHRNAFRHEPRATDLALQETLNGRMLRSDDGKRSTLFQAEVPAGVKCDMSGGESAFVDKRWLNTRDIVKKRKKRSLGRPGACVFLW